MFVYYTFSPARVGEGVGEGVAYLASSPSV